MKEFLGHCRPHLAYGGVFSLVVNVLLLAVPLYTLQVYDRVLTSRSLETLWLLTAVALAAVAAYSAIDALRGRLQASAAVALDDLVSPQALGDVLSRAAAGGGGDSGAALRDAATLRGFLASPAVTALFDLPWFPVYLGIVFLMHWQFSVVATAGAALIFGLAVLNETCTRSYSSGLQDATRACARHIDGAVRCAEVIGVLGMRQAFARGWQALNRDVVDRSLRIGRRQGLFAGLTRFSRLALQVAMLAVGACLVLSGEVSGGAMVAASMVLARALGPVEAVVGGWRGIVEARGAYGRLRALSVARQDVAGTVLPSAVEGRVSLEAVAYAFSGTGRAALAPLSLAVRPGEYLGLVGPSASGKSTLARLVVGALRPSSGTVRIDGADVARWPQDHLGNFLGYVPQCVALMAGTVAQNIARFGPADSEAVMAAARRANAHDMILRLPQGYETDVGPDGCALSGGQRQLIGIARALFGAPRVVVMDEPNANLDGDAELRLVRTLGELKAGGVTLVVVSHRPSLLAHADTLLMLREGTTDHYGLRDEVLAKIAQAAAQPAPNVRAISNREARLA